MMCTYIRGVLNDVHLYLGHLVPDGWRGLGCQLSRWQSDVIAAGGGGSAKPGQAAQAGNLHTRADRCREAWSQGRSGCFK